MDAKRPTEHRHIPGVHLSPPSFTSFIPTAEEITGYLNGLGFTHNDSLMLWERDDGVQLADTHDRNFIRAPDEAIIAIDVQPRLLPGHEFNAVRHG